jgi:multisubunit Na+/H+ antiporter MnhB subunit
VIGAVVSLRIVAGLQRPDRCIGILAAGGVIAALLALSPVVAGDPLLDQVVVDFTLPVVGKVKTGSAALFDLGVSLIVVGTVIAVLDGLGATSLAPGGEEST